MPTLKKNQNDDRSGYVAGWAATAFSREEEGSAGDQLSEVESQFYYHAMQRILPGN